MKVKVLTMTGGEYIFSNAKKAEYEHNGTIFTIGFIEENKTKKRDFPVVNIESIEIENE